jgi:YidC/Oxa1 family membrane protein insertase
MPNIRLMLWGVLAAILFINYQTWLRDYEPPAGSAAQNIASTSGAPASTLGDSVPQAASSAAPATPAPGSAPPVAAAPASATPAATPPATPEADSNSGPQLRVTTDVLDVGINL